MHEKHHKSHAKDRRNRWERNTPSSRKSDILAHPGRSFILPSTTLIVLSCLLAACTNAPQDTVISIGPVIHPGSFPLDGLPPTDAVNSKPECMVISITSNSGFIKSIVGDGPSSVLVTPTLGTEGTVTGDIGVAGTNIWGKCKQPEAAIPFTLEVDTAPPNCIISPSGANIMSISCNEEGRAIDPATGLPIPEVASLRGTNISMGDARTRTIIVQDMHGNSQELLLNLPTTCIQTQGVYSINSDSSVTAQFFCDGSGNIDIGGSVQPIGPGLNNVTISGLDSFSGRVIFNGTETPIQIIPPAGTPPIITLSNARIHGGNVEFDASCISGIGGCNVVIDGMQNNIPGDGSLSSVMTDAVIGGANSHFETQVCDALGPVGGHCTSVGFDIPSMPYKPFDGAETSKVERDGLFHWGHNVTVTVTNRDQTGSLGPPKVSFNQPDNQAWWIEMFNSRQAATGDCNVISSSGGSTTAICNLPHGGAAGIDVALPENGGEVLHLHTDIPATVPAKIGEFLVDNGLCLAPIGLLGLMLVSVGIQRKRQRAEDQYDDIIKYVNEERKKVRGLQDLLKEREYRDAPKSKRVDMQRMDKLFKIRGRINRINLERKEGDLRLNDIFKLTEIRNELLILLQGDEMSEREHAPIFEDIRVETQKRIWELNNLLKQRVFVYDENGEVKGVKRSGVDANCEVSRDLVIFLATVTESTEKNFWFWQNVISVFNVPSNDTSNNQDINFLTKDNILQLFIAFIGYNGIKGGLFKKWSNFIKKRFGIEMTHNAVMNRFSEMAKG